MENNQTYIDKVNNLLGKPVNELFIMAQNIETVLRMPDLRPNDKEDLLLTKKAIGYCLSEALYTPNDYQTLEKLNKNPFFSTKQFNKYNYYILSKYLKTINNTLNMASPEDRKNLEFSRYKILQILIDRGLVEKPSSKKLSLEKTLIS